MHQPLHAQIRQWPSVLPRGLAASAAGSWRRGTSRARSRSQTMSAVALLVPPLQFEKLGVDAVDPDQRMLSDRRLDRGIRFRTRILQLPPLVDAALDEDRQHRRTDHPLIEAAHLVEKRPIALRGGEQFDLVEIRAAEPPALPHAQEQLRVRRRPADAAGLLLVDVGGQHLARVLRRTRMTHDPREKLREVAHVHRPLLLEVREQALKRHAPLGKPGPRPVVLAVEDSEQTVLEHPRSLPGVARRGEELAVDALDSAGEVGGGAWTRTTYLRIMSRPSPLEARGHYSPSESGGRCRRSSYRYGFGTRRRKQHRNAAASAMTRFRCEFDR